MSKIEKALSQARRDGKMALVPVAPDKRTEHTGAVTASPPAQAVGFVSHAASVAAIARMQEDWRLSSQELSGLRIIAPDAGENAAVQAFRELRTKILHQTQGQNAVILVTSVTGGGGASFVATNLGVAFAFDAGRTALLVDCNLRNPSLHRMLPDPALPGLTDYLENHEVDVGDIIHSVGIERMRLIPAGTRRETPAEYFTSQRIREFLAGLRGRYPERMVVLDAPPMTDSADTRILTELCDYVLLVVPYGYVTRMQIENCIKSLDGRKLLGIVFNNEPRFPRLDWRMLVRQARIRARAMFADLGRRARRLLNFSHKNA